MRIDLLGRWLKEYPYGYRDGMKELRELYSKATQGEWCSLHHYNDVFVAENTTVCTTQNGDDARLIAAMHNALPELLDAWEMVQALELANQISWEHLRVYTAWWEGADELYEQVLDYCKTCLFHGDCKDEPCSNPWKHRYEWLSAWRDAQKNEGVE